MTDLRVRMLEQARRFLEAARLIVEQGNDLLPVAHEDARHAAELAGKSLLVAATGTYPQRSHKIGGDLAAAGVVPAALDESQISNFLADHTRGRYGFFEEFTGDEVMESIWIAEVLVDAAAQWPDGQFHPARGEPS